MIRRLGRVAAIRVAGWAYTPTEAELWHEFWGEPESIAGAVADAIVDTGRVPLEDRARLALRRRLQEAGRG